MPGCVIFGYKVHVEVPLLLLFYSFMVSEAVYTNLVIYRTCYVILGYNQSECALLGTENKDSMTQHLEQVAEPRASVINMVCNFIEGLGSGVVCLFVGPWSDKFGRKPVMLLCLLCLALKHALRVVFCSFPTLSPWYLIIASIPMILSGGFVACLTSILSYITDTTTRANRGVRMGVFEAVLTLGLLLGNLSGPYIFYATSYTFVFGLCSICCLIALVFTYFCIPESLAIVETDGHFSGVFQTSHIKEMCKTTLKQRENYRRGIVLCSVILLAVYILIINGSSSVMFLYLRTKFQWSLKTFQLYNCLSNIVYITGTIFGVWVLHKLLKVTESVLVLTGFISLLNCALLQGLAVKNWHIYFSCAVHGLSGVISPMVRSLVSKCVDTEDVGKIFSLIIVFESLLGMLGSPLYTAIYNATINMDVGVFNYVSSGLLLFDIIMILAIICMEYHTPHSSYTRIDKNLDDYNANPEATIADEVSIPS